MTNKAPLDVEIGFGMKAAGKVVGVAEMIESDLAHARHQAHVEHDIDAVRDLDADLAEARTRGPHEKRNHVERPAAHRAGINFRKLIVRLGWRHPIIVGARFLLLIGANESKIFGARHVVERAAMQITTRAVPFD